MRTWTPPRRSGSTRSSISTGLAGHGRQTLRERGELGVVERRGAGHDGRHDAPAAVVEPPELADDRAELVEAATPDEQRDEVARAAGHAVAEQPVEQLDPCRDGDRGAGEDARDAARPRGAPRPRSSAASHASTVSSRTAISKAASA